MHWTVLSGLVAYFLLNIYVISVTGLTVVDNTGEPISPIAALAAIQLLIVVILLILSFIGAIGYLVYLWLLSMSMYLQDKWRTVNSEDEKH